VRSQFQVLDAHKELFSAAAASISSLLSVVFAACGSCARFFQFELQAPSKKVCVRTPGESDRLPFPLLAPEKDLRDTWAG
jgi:hypothetical protein